MTTSIDRRTLLRIAGTSAGTAVLAGAVLHSADPAHAADAAFRHGVASGDPTPDGVLLWTRVTPTDDATPGSGDGPDVTLTWQVATDPDFTVLAAAGTIATGASRDHTVKVDCVGLAPGTTYWYRFGYQGQWSPVGRTTTAPAATADVDELRVGVVSCANWEAGHFAAYRHLARRTDLDLVVHLGDYLYEYGTGEFAAGDRVVRPVRPAHETLSLADYRVRHALYKSDPDLQALHAAVPWAITWDDHEVANDQWSGGAENHTPGVEGDWGRRLAAARQAYFEWMPVRVGSDGHIYRRLRFGRLAELSLLDLRTHRSEQASGVAVDDPTRTITGADQMRWLRTGLVDSDARWKLVGNPVMIARLDVGSLPAWLLGPLGRLLGIPENGLILNVDQWDGYNADRNALVDELQRAGTTDVVFLTGDIHTSWANEITTRSTGPNRPAAVEFVVPSVTSDNVDDFLGLPAGNALSALAAGLLRATNPHVRWTELDGHGYGVVTVTTQRCRMDWYHLADRTDPASGSSWVAGWSVEAGTAALRREYAPSQSYLG
ncbi:alkaline phosphatase D family protein [Solwaraspora sp. WMMD406]|uniref:alkaline phosphatase D family protein n=1 Tax=Solwaraspora sp. WMMD406 TaxID=3016095 RepID=UPI0024173C9F|nr:alkaline phosphatase D family protein [Solwaraspora sp. WMMD406]MDG4766093.1 alkaline phosphatase D family protein [Solwaraspora sp. WMMD406]